MVCRHSGKNTVNHKKLCMVTFFIFWGGWIYSCIFNNQWLSLMSSDAHARFMTFDRTFTFQMSTNHAVCSLWWMCGLSTRDFRRFPAETVSGGGGGITYLHIFLCHVLKVKVKICSQYIFCLSVQFFKIFLIGLPGFSFLVCLFIELFSHYTDGFFWFAVCFLHEYV